MTSPFSLLLSMMVLNVLLRLHVEAKSHVLLVKQGVWGFSFGMQKQEVLFMTWHFFNLYLFRECWLSMTHFWALLNLICLHTFRARELMSSVISHWGALLVLCLAQGQHRELSSQQLSNFVSGFLQILSFDWEKNNNIVTWHWLLKPSGYHRPIKEENH